jgi:glycosyltransferase involved in cell wall biosynthesis
MDKDAAPLPPRNAGGLAVANNMIMEAETAHVLQTCQMLAAFTRVAPRVSYLWPDFGRRVALLNTIPAAQQPLSCRFRYGIGRYAEFTVRLLARLARHPVPLLFTRSLGVALAAQILVPRVMLELHQGLSRRARLVAPLLGPRVRVVAISEGLRRDLVGEGGLAPERVTVCHDAAEVERFATAEPLPAAGRPLPERPGRLNHLYYGTLRPERGLALIAHAARCLPDHGFVLVGGGAAEVAAALAAGLDLPNVRVVPAVPHDQVPRLIRSYDSVLLPYTRAVTTHRWMSPLKLFEAMASGVPAVVSRLDSIVEVVDDRHVSFIDCDDPDSLPAALGALAADPQAARARAAAAQELTARRHSWERRARDILAFAGGALAAAEPPR